MKSFVVFIVLFAVSLAENVQWANLKPIGEFKEISGSNLAENGNINKFIVGGREAAIHQFPFHVAVVTEHEFGNALCSGSLISRQAVLTAAICVAGVTNVSLHLGARDMNIEERYHAVIFVELSNVRIHPEFTRQHRVSKNDVAIVRLSNPIAFFPPGISVIKLPSLADLTNDFSNDEVITMGFGRTSSNRQQNSYINRYSEVSTLSNSDCQDLTNFVRVEDQHICTKGDALCSGSLGGPLIITRNGQRAQIGIASFYSGDCARNDPSGFTRITYRPIYDWIKANM